MPETVTTCSMEFEKNPYPNEQCALSKDMKYLMQITHSGGSVTHCPDGFQFQSHIGPGSSNKSYACSVEPEVILMVDKL